MSDYRITKKNAPCTCGSDKDSAVHLTAEECAKMGDCWAPEDHHEFKAATQCWECGNDYPE